MFLIEIERRLRAVRWGTPPEVAEAVEEDLESFQVYLSVSVQRDLNPGGMGIPFSELEGVLQRVLDQLEGQRLNELEVFDRKPPSLENMAQFIFNKTAILLERGGGIVSEVRIQADRGRSVTYRKSLHEQDSRTAERIREFLR